LFYELNINKENNKWYHWLMSGLSSTTHCSSNCKDRQS